MPGPAEPSFYSEVDEPGSSSVTPVGRHSAVNHCYAGITIPTQRSRPAAQRGGKKPLSRRRSCAANGVQTSLPSASALNDHP